MKITFLGQAGLLFEIDGTTILVDPYLSNEVAKYEPNNVRRVKVDEKYLNIKPDIIIITHNHLDHFDKPTLANYLNDGNVTVLSPSSVWKEIRGLYKGNNNYILFNPYTKRNEKGLSFEAVHAVHSDPDAIGVIINDKKDNYYISGDTLLSNIVLNDLKGKTFKAIFIPINGKGNNMNKEDAYIFSNNINTKYVVPLHFGMFDDLDPSDFKANNKVIPEIYKEIILK